MRTLVLKEKRRKKEEERKLLEFIQRMRSPLQPTIDTAMHQSFMVTEIDMARHDITSTKGHMTALEGTVRGDVDWFPASGPSTNCRAYTSS